MSPRLGAQDYHDDECDDGRGDDEDDHENPRRESAAGRVEEMREPLAEAIPQTGLNGIPRLREFVLEEATSFAPRRIEGRGVEAQHDRDHACAAAQGGAAVPCAVWMSWTSRPSRRMRWST